MYLPISSCLFTHGPPPFQSAHMNKASLTKLYYRLVMGNSGSLLGMVLSIIACFRDLSILPRKKALMTSLPQCPLATHAEYAD